MNWFISPEMAGSALSVTNKFGYDQQGVINYKFNKVGFRSPEFTEKRSLITIGNSISFGVGLDEKNAYGYKTAQQLNLEYINLSIGCYPHTNHQYLQNIANMLERDTDDVFVIQINNLARDNKNCVDKFLNYFDQVTELLKHKQKLFVYWDDIQHDLPKSVSDQILIYNKFHLDNSIAGQPQTFGVKSHNAIFQILCSKLT